MSNAYTTTDCKAAALEAADVAERFLEWLRPGGSWVLTGVLPDKSTDPAIPLIITITAHTATDIRAFVSEHNGVRNLYYSVNPTKGPMSKKASKTDIAAIEYLLADLDPNSNETSEDAKARYLVNSKRLSPSQLEKLILGMAFKVYGG